MWGGGGSRGRRAEKWRRDEGRGVGRRRRSIIGGSSVVKGKKLGGRRGGRGEELQWMMVGMKVCPQRLLMRLDGPFAPSLTVQQARCLAPPLLLHWLSSSCLPHNPCLPSQAVPGGAQPARPAAAAAPPAGPSAVTSEKV